MLDAQMLTLLFQENQVIETSSVMKYFVAIKLYQMRLKSCYLAWDCSGAYSKC